MAVSITQTANPAGVTATSNVATYSSVSIGTAHPDRIVVVLVGTELASSTPSACTIDYGSGATAMTAGTLGNLGGMFARTFRLAVPTGTTATIKVTYSATNPSNVQNHIAVYSVVDGVFSSAGGDGSTDMDVTDPLTTGAITIPTGGGFIAVAVGATDTVAKTWANATEDIDADVGNLRFTTATRTTALIATAVTCRGGTNGEDGAMSWLIFTDLTPSSSPSPSLSPSASLSPSSSASASVSASVSPSASLSPSASASRSVSPSASTSPSSSASASISPSASVSPSVAPGISIVNKTSGIDNTDATSYTTASITPTSNCLILATVSTRMAAAAPNEPTASGCGLTWVVVQSVIFDDTGTQKRKTTFRGMGASPSSGTVTFDFGGQTQTNCVWIIDEASGVDTSGTNGSGAIAQSVTAAPHLGGATGTSITATLAAFSSADNATYGVFTNDGTDFAFTVGSGFTQLAEINDIASGENTLAMMSEWKSTNDTTVDASLSGVAAALGGIAIEIVAAATGSSSVSASASASLSPSASVSPSASASSSVSPSSSVSRSISPSASVSPSASASRSVSPSASTSPSASVSASTSPSSSASPSASASRSVSPSASTSPSASASRSVSPSTSFSPSASASRSQSPSASVSPSSSQSRSVSPSSSFSSSASVSPSGAATFVKDVIGVGIIPFKR